MYLIHKLTLGPQVWEGQVHLEEDSQVAFHGEGKEVKRDEGGRDCSPDAGPKETSWEVQHRPQGRRVGVHSSSASYWEEVSSLLYLRFLSSAVEVITPVTEGY